MDDDTKAMLFLSGIATPIGAHRLRAKFYSSVTFGNGWNY